LSSMLLEPAAMIPGSIMYSRICGHPTQARDALDGADLVLPPAGTLDAPSSIHDTAARLSNRTAVTTLNVPACCPVC